MRTKRMIRIALLTSMATSWCGYGCLIIRQKHLLLTADPMNDTGTSIGYTVLIQFGPPLLIVFSLIVTVGFHLLGKTQKSRCRIS
jgi:hypothetical protein